MSPITSVRNSHVKAAAALHRRKERAASGCYLVEGPHAVDEALTAGDVAELFVTPALADRYTTHDVPRRLVVDHVLSRLADARTPQGVVAVARQRSVELSSLAGRGLLVVVDRVADPGNAGAIIRTADAAGAVGVVLTTGSVDPYNPKSVRAATGSLSHVPVVTNCTLMDVAQVLRATGQRLVGLDAHATALLDDSSARTPPVALVFGNEAHGLPDDAPLDVRVRIPIYGRAESLNLAAAVAVACYAVARSTHHVPDDRGA